MASNRSGQGIPQLLVPDCGSVSTQYVVYSTLERVHFSFLELSLSLLSFIFLVAVHLNQKKISTNATVDQGRLLKLAKMIQSKECQRCFSTVFH